MQTRYLVFVGEFDEVVKDTHTVDIARGAQHLLHVPVAVLWSAMCCPRKLFRCSVGSLWIEGCGCARGLGRHDKNEFVHCSV